MKIESKNFPANNQKLIRSFGRIKSRKLSDHKNFLLDNLLPKYSVDLGYFERIKKYQKSAIEIGFGFGDFLFEKAKNNPDTFFIGFEPHINGVVNLLNKLNKYPLDNIAIHAGDFRAWIIEQEKLTIFDHIFILFPDPWPKFKHFKRRLINQDFLDNVLSKILQKGSMVTIATDHDSYKSWILSELLKSKDFQWLAANKKDWQNFPSDWIQTKYQKKAAFEGRESVIFNLKKIK